MSYKKSNFRIGLSTTVLNLHPDSKGLDGIGIYTKSLFGEYLKAGLAPQGFSFPTAHSKKDHNELASTFNSLILKDMLLFQKPLDVPVDIFHVTDYRAVKMSCPVVTTLYDAIPFVNPTMASNKFRSLKNYVLRRSVKYTDHVVAISNYSVKELVEHYNISESRISVVHCGVDDEWLNVIPSQEQIKRVLYKYNIHSSYLLTVGTLQPRKNILRLLQAHDRLPTFLRKSYPLVVVGKRGWNAEPIIVKLKEKMALKEAHWLCDVDSRDALQCIYAGAEAFLFPSLHEGFGLPVLESFAMGVPVLTSNTTSLPEVSNGIALEVNPLSLDEITDGIREMLNLPYRDATIAAGRARASELTWSKCADETLKVYKKVLEGK